MLTVAHVDHAASHPSWSPAKARPATRVQPELPRHPEANALRLALRYRCGGDKVEVLFRRLAVSESDMKRALNSHPTPPRILARLSAEEREVYYATLASQEAKAA